MTMANDHSLSTKYMEWHETKK